MDSIKKKIHLCIFQCRGIGRVTNSVTSVTAFMAITKIISMYLFAFAPTLPVYYARLGFNKISEDKFKGHPVTVMEIAL